MEEKRYYQVSIKDYSSICPNCYWNQLQKKDNNKKYYILGDKNEF